MFYFVSPHCGSRGSHVEKAIRAGEGLLQGDPDQRCSHRDVHGDHTASDISALQIPTTENISC